MSDDNAYAEALFRTAKYRPEFAVKGFADLQATRTWAAGFVHWYNVDHRHSAIRYVSPAQRHEGEDHAMRCMSKRVRSIGQDGQARHAIGRLWVRSR